MQTRHRAAADQGETGEGPDPTSMDLMARVANLCDTVAQRLVLADHGPQGQGPRPQVPVPLYTGYDDRKSVADFLAELAAYKLATGASDEWEPWLRRKPGTGSTRHRAAADQGETGEGPDPTSMELMARVANLCDTVAQRLVVADHGPQGQGPRPQVPVPLYTGYDDRKSVADFLAELAAYKLATGASDEYVLARVLPVAFQASAARWWRIVQPRPLTTDPPAEVPEPFRGNTLTHRHPNDPVQFYDEEERRLLCPLCGVPEIHRGTHQAGALYRARESAAAARAAVLRLAASGRTQPPAGPGGRSGPKTRPPPPPPPPPPLAGRHRN
ncbi:hypothetical protein ISCGN_002053 [Ixodes scapularis]